MYGWYNTSETLDNQTANVKVGIFRRSGYGAIKSLHKSK